MVGQWYDNSDSMQLKRQLEHGRQSGTYQNIDISFSLRKCRESKSSDCRLPVCRLLAIKTYYVDISGIQGYHALSDNIYSRT